MYKFKAMLFFSLFFLLFSRLYAIVDIGVGISYTQSMFFEDRNFKLQPMAPELNGKDYKSVFSTGGMSLHTKLYVGGKIGFFSELYLTLPFVNSISANDTSYKVSLKDLKFIFLDYNFNLGLGFFFNKYGGPEFLFAFGLGVAPELKPYKNNSADYFLSNVYLTIPLHFTINFKVKENLYMYFSTTLSYEFIGLLKGNTNKYLGGFKLQPSIGFSLPIATRKASYR